MTPRDARDGRTLKEFGTRLASGNPRTLDARMLRSMQCLAMSSHAHEQKRFRKQVRKVVRLYAESVRATTDAAWESRIREACEAGRKEHSLDCLVHVVQNTPDICDCDAKDHNSALSALLARLGIPEEGR